MTNAGKVGRGLVWRRHFPSDHVFPLDERDLWGDLWCWGRRHNSVRPHDTCVHAPLTVQIGSQQLNTRYSSFKKRVRKKC